MPIYNFQMEKQDVLAKTFEISQRLKSFHKFYTLLQKFDFHYFFPRDPRGYGNKNIFINGRNYKNKCECINTTQIKREVNKSNFMNSMNPKLQMCSALQDKTFDATLHSFGEFVFVAVCLLDPHCRLLSYLSGKVNHQNFCRCCP